jgi:hypothetical protein
MAKVNWEKVLTDSWVNNHRDLTEEEAEKKLIESEFGVKNLLYEKDNHDQLNAAKEIVKDLNAGFNSAIKYEKAKIQFLLEQIENIRIAKKALEEQQS